MAIRRIHVIQASLQDIEEELAAIEAAERAHEEAERRIAQFQVHRYHLPSQRRDPFTC